MRHKELLDQARSMVQDEGHKVLMETNACVQHKAQGGKCRDCVSDEACCRVAALYMHLTFSELSATLGE